MYNQSQTSIKSWLWDPTTQFHHIHFLHNYPTEGLSLCAVPPHTPTCSQRSDKRWTDQYWSIWRPGQIIEMKSGKWDIDNWTRWALWLALHTVCFHLLDLTEWPRKVQKLDWKWNAYIATVVALYLGHSFKCTSEANPSWINVMTWINSCSLCNKFQERTVKKKKKKSIMWCHPWTLCIHKALGGHVLCHIVVSNQSRSGESSVYTHTHSQTIFSTTKWNRLPSQTPRRYMQNNPCREINEHNQYQEWRFLKHMYCEKCSMYLKTNISTYVYTHHLLTWLCYLWAFIQKHPTVINSKEDH